MAIGGESVKTTELHTDPVAGATSNRATRAASLGLAAVVICLAVFSIFAAYTTQTQVARMEHAESLHESYIRAIAAIRAEESAELEYLVDPSAEHRAGMVAAANALFNAVNEIEIHGGEADARLAKDVLTLHDQFVVASEKLTAAVERGDTVEARRIDEDEADPVFHAMHDLITAEQTAREAEARSAFAALHETADVTLILAPLVFAVGFALLLVLWRVLEGYHRATRKTYREIEQLSRLRSEFVSIVSHEFRTPLTGIQGFSEMMRDEVLTMPEVQEYAGDINKDARRLARLITDMLDLDRMESGKMTLNSEAVDLNRVVGDAAAQFRLSAADHPIELDLDDLPPVRGDPDRLTQVVTNLLSNAIKYSPSGGAVELKTERTEKTVTFTVRDHGIGIPDDQLETIFDRYSRVQSTETRTIQGTGLGLPIVRQIVQLHGGTVWATSELGQGSVFHVQLPVLESASLASRAA
jgi:signal transduction histidine kinase